VATEIATRWADLPQENLPDNALEIFRNNVTKQPQPTYRYHPHGAISKGRQGGPSRSCKRLGANPIRRSCQYKRADRQDLIRFFGAILSVFI
jgi:hypothetical protein